MNMLLLGDINQCHHLATEFAVAEKRNSKKQNLDV
jgi:hypothetical protein